MWDPPKTKEELEVANPLLYRWTGGEAATLTRQSLPRQFEFKRHSVASVFVQTESRHLLCTNINAAEVDVKNSKNATKWSRLFFDHERNAQDRSEYFTALVFAGGQELTAAPMSSNCMPQLIPDVYNNENSTRKNAGVIGKLPLLIALAAFSARREHLREVLTRSLRPGRWVLHGHESGRRTFVPHRKPFFS